MTGLTKGGRWAHKLLRAMYRGGTEEGRGRGYHGSPTPTPPPQACWAAGEGGRGKGQEGRRGPRHDRYVRITSRMTARQMGH
ncbi:hypothetical protein E2C01_041886 [Portunus trituberculatus]|uniref:Uncharacterized protein n=1 Tax=Portunus trituberculatus TaxID=210409 RepID=A0A5B7FKD8_PORTR|nr:hypothetical protein [Portunus trituberculatus]